MNLFVNCLCNETNKIEENNIIAFITSDTNKRKFVYYENNDIELQTTSNANLLASLPFITTEEKVIDYMSGNNQIYFRKNYTDENFVNFIKDYIHGVKEDIKLCTPMSVENFIVFKRKLISYYEDPSKLIKILTDEDKEGTVVSYDVVKEILKEDYKWIKDMEYIPYNAVLLNLEQILSFSRSQISYESMIKTINDNKSNFIVLSKFKFELMKLCLGLPLLN